MKLLILTASFGGGHNSVAFALKKALKSHFAIEAEVCDLYEHFNPTINKITAKGYVWIMKRLPTLYGLFYNYTYDLEKNNILNKFLSRLGLKTLRKLLQVKSPQGIVAVYPTYAGLLSKLKSEGHELPKTFVVITDYMAHVQWLHDGIDFYFVPSFEVKWHLYKKGVLCKNILVTGIPIQPEFDELRSDERSIVMISAGLFGMTPSIFEIGDTLEETAPEGYELLMLCGKDESLYQRAKESFHRIKALPGVLPQKELAELMGRTSLLISKAGGLTVSEALASEIPMIVYKPLPGQEFFNTLYLLKNEAALVAKNKKELKRILKAFFDGAEIREKLLENIRRMRKPKSSYLVAKHIYDELQKRD